MEVSEAFVAQYNNADGWEEQEKLNHQAQKLLERIKVSLMLHNNKGRNGRETSRVLPMREFALLGKTLRMRLFLFFWSTANCCFFADILREKVTLWSPKLPVKVFVAKTKLGWEKLVQGQNV